MESVTYNTASVTRKGKTREESCIRVGKVATVKRCIADCKALAQYQSWQDSYNTNRCSVDCKALANSSA